MTAPAISHLICTSALVVLIFVMPFFYVTIADDIQMNTLRRQLKEITDYVSNTLANLHFLVNSSDSMDVSLEKQLLYLPSSVGNQIYILQIDGSGTNASSIVAYLKHRSSVKVEAWLLPGLKKDTKYQSVESREAVAVAGCRRNGTDFYVWIKYPS